MAKGTSIFPMTDSQQLTTHLSKVHKLVTPSSWALLYESVTEELTLRAKCAAHALCVSWRVEIGKEAELDLPPIEQRKNTGWLGYIGDYTAQVYRDYGVHGT